MTATPPVAIDRSPEAGTPVLSVRGVSHSFGAVQVLHAIDLQVWPRERLALIGPNGAGKTTLFNVLSGQLRPTQGALWLQGKRMDGLPAHRMAHAGVARGFQVSQLFTSMTVLEHLRCALMPQRARVWWLGMRSAMQHRIDAQAWAVLEQFDLQAQAHSPAQSLSYAQQRLLDVALVAASCAPLWLLDEPTSGMSQQQALRCVEQIRHVASDQTLIFVEHDMAVAFALATRVAVLVEGRLLAVGTPEAIRQDPAVQAVYLGHNDAQS